MKHVIPLFIGGLILFSCSYLPEEGGLDTNLKKDRGDYAVYYSGNVVPAHAFLMVPGGLVDPHVYECWIDRLVRNDPTVAVVLLKYPSNLPITRTSKVMKVAKELDEFSHWAIGGHSLGGVVAASAVYRDTNFFDGLILMASWSRAASDLSGWENTVLSIYASEDQLATEEEVLGSSEFLPPGITITSPEELATLSAQTAYFKIEGGNHAGFGCYGPQKGDGKAFIDSGEQQDQMIGIMKSYFDVLWE